MVIADNIAERFCEDVHNQLAGILEEPQQVRAKVAYLESINSCQESCFTKGVMLPVVDAVTTCSVENPKDESREDHDVVREHFQHGLGGA